MKIDMHVHTAEASRCASFPGEETCRAYKAAGYDAIVITNHMAENYIREYAKERIAYVPEIFTDAYAVAESAGKNCGLRTFMGVELTLKRVSADFLIYGDISFLLDRFPDIFDLSVKELSALCKENGALLYQAHPFRNNMQITQPDYLFGIETKNGAAHHDSRNDIANLWADKYGLHKVAGSDCHHSRQVGTTGIETDLDIKTTADLVEMLKTDNYRII